MEFTIITLFPEIFTPIFNTSILKRAQKEKHITINYVNIRDHGEGKHKTVDDRPYGGGAGMLLRVDVLHNAILQAKKNIPGERVILLDPKGRKYTQAVAEEYKETLSHLIFICGRYEGYDERIKNYIDEELSVGDFVLTGGEYAAMIVVDSVTRLLPGVLKKEEAPLYESFSAKGTDRILEHAHYTRPVEYDGEKVPDVLLSGNFAEIEKYRESDAVKTTHKKRPDLLKKSG